jgi:hypothetical protein
MTLIVCSFVFILLNNLESRNNHTYYVEVKFVQYFQGTSLIRLLHTTYMEVVQFQCIFNVKEI